MVLQDYINKINELERFVKTSKLAVGGADSYDENIAKLRLEIRDAQHQINYLKDQFIKVSLSDLKESAARVLDVITEDVAISHYTTADSNEFVEASKLKARIEKNQTRSIHRRDYITYVVFDRNNPSRTVNFTNALNLNDVQKDGKILDKHCYVYHSPEGATRLDIDNYDNIVLKFAIKEFLMSSETGLVSRSDMGRCIVDASIDRDNVLEN